MHVDPITDRINVKIDDPSHPRIEYYYRFPQADTQPKRGWFKSASLEFVQTWVEVTPSFDLVTGMMGKHPILSLTPFEVVDGYQFHGRQPVHIMSRDGSRIAEHCPTVWEVASMNKSTGERFPMVFSCASRDEVTRVNYRLNLILSYCRSILSMFNGDLAKNGKVPLDELKEVLAENPPNFS